MQTLKDKPATQPLWVRFLDLLTSNTVAGLLIGLTFGTMLGGYLTTSYWKEQQTIYQEFLLENGIRFDPVLKRPLILPPARDE